MPKVRTIRLAAYPIWASCSAVGSMLTVVSAEDDVLLEDEHVHTAHDAGLRVRADDLERGADGLGVVRVDARKQGVGIAARHHHRAEVVPVVQQLVGLAVAEALPLPLLPQLEGVLLATR